MWKHEKLPITEKWRNKAENFAKNFSFKFMKSSMWKAFDINNIRIERDMLRALATVSAKTDKKIAVQGVDLKH